jgi:hypothetical protein
LGRLFRVVVQKCFFSRRCAVDAEKKTRDARKRPHNRGHQFRHSDHPRDDRRRAAAPASRHHRQQRDLAVEALAIMSLAGAEAERFFFPDADDFGDAIDLKMIRGYLQPSTVLEFIAEIARLRLAAWRLVMGSRRQIEIVADARCATVR